MNEKSKEAIHRLNELLRVGRYTTDDIFTKWELDAYDRSHLAKYCLTDDDKKLSFYSGIMGIYSSLHAIFENPEQANAWIKRPNAHYDGLSALLYMQSGELEAIWEVRNYLYGQLT